MLQRRGTGGSGQARAVADVTPSAVPAWPRERLAGHERPRDGPFTTEAELPRGATGTLVRQEVAGVPATDDRRI